MRYASARFDIGHIPSCPVFRDFERGGVNLIRSGPLDMNSQVPS